MRRALLKKFALVLLAALFLNSLIFYGASSRSILNSTREDMLYILESADSLLEYGGDLNGQVWVNVRESDRQMCARGRDQSLINI